MLMAITGAALACPSCASKERVDVTKDAELPSASASAAAAPPSASASAAAALPEDPSVASTRKSCEEEGDAMECFTLGWMYDKGRKVPQDEARGAVFYQKACDTGFGPSCFNLGNMFADGRGVAKDGARARSLYRKACEGNVKPACDRLKDAGG
jgi:TPR repeat protein